MQTGDTLIFWPFQPLLTAEEARMLQTHTARHRYIRGTLLNNESGAMGAVLVLRGRLRVYLMGSEGRTVTLMHVEKDECFVLGSVPADIEGPLGVMLETETDCQLAVTSERTLDYLMERSAALTRWMYHSTMRSAGIMLRAAQRALFAGIPQRTAQALLAESRRQSSLQLCITQERLAREASSSREVITRMLGEFAERGLVCLSRGKIELLAPEALRGIAAGAAMEKREEQLSNGEM